MLCHVLRGLAGNRTLLIFVTPPRCALSFSLSLSHPEPLWQGRIHLKFPFTAVEAPGDTCLVWQLCWVRGCLCDGSRCLQGQGLGRGPPLGVAFFPTNPSRAAFGVPSLGQTLTLSPSGRSSWIRSPSPCSLGSRP